MNFKHCTVQLMAFLMFDYYFDVCKVGMNMKNVTGSANDNTL